MESSRIGKTILELRKTKGVTQENLADFVGVSAQAVSKWEGGGIPDIELLPKIADYFGVSIDSLFDRNTNDYAKLKMDLSEVIAEVPNSQKFQKAFDYCWALEKGIMGITDDENTLDDIIKKDNYLIKNDKGNVYSQMIFNEGITLTGLNEELRYFLIMPEPQNGWKKELGYKDQYVELFEFLSRKTVLKTLYFLYERENRPFTQKLIKKAADINDETADIIMKDLLKYKFISQSTMELDDEIITVYNFTPNPAFIAVLTMCNELIDVPSHFYCSASIRNRPYFTNS